MALTQGAVQVSIAVSALLCEKCAFRAIIPCSPLLTKVTHGMDCSPDVLVLPSAESSAAASV